MRLPSAILTIGMALLIGLTGCTRAQEDEKLMIFHGSIRDQVKSWDPANAYDSISLTVVPLVYETLYEYEYLADTYRLVPLLAAELPQLSPDRLTVTIPLKRGIHFQDDPCFKATQGKGREVKAQDFIYSFKRLAHPSLQSSGWWTVDQKIVGIHDFHEQLIKAPREEQNRIFNEVSIAGIQALDDYTLQIKLNAPYPQLLYILAMTFTSPLPHEAVETYADERGNLTDHPVGTGPFRLKKWDRTHRLVLEKNPNFRTELYPTQSSLDLQKKGFLTDAGKPLPFLEQVSFDVIKEQQPSWLSFMKGKQDWITIPKDNFGEAIVNKVNLAPEFAAKGLRLNIETGTVFYFVSFNMQDKILGTNKYLRQALSSAINREQWIETFTNGTGLKMTTALPPGLLDRPKNTPLKYDYNLSLAKELLKKAGYPEGKGLPVFNFDLRGASSVDRQYGEFFTQQWRAIGVQINPIMNTFPAYLEKARQGNLQISLGGWALDYPDAENVYQLLYGPNRSPGPNETQFNHPMMNELYEKMARMEPGAARAQLIKKMDDLLQEEVPWALGYYSALYQLSQPWVLNLRSNEMYPNRFKYLRINPEIKKRYLLLQ